MTHRRLWGAAAAVAGTAALATGTLAQAPARAQLSQRAQMPQGQRGAQATQPTPGDVRAGHDLFQVACTTCHGLDAAGTNRGPTLIGVGAASVDFYLSTGRMPLDNPGKQAQRKRPAYTPLQIRQLVAYVSSLAPGPPVPDISPSSGDIVEGNVLYANNCAPCHSSAGAGGALGHANYAPRLNQATPTQVAEAIRIGPGPMPLFGPDTFNNEQVASIVRYVEYLRHPDDRGGLGLGHLGPIPEGFVAWVIGLGLLVVAVRWIGTRD